LCCDKLLTTPKNFAAMSDHESSKPVEGAASGGGDDLTGADIWGDEQAESDLPSEILELSTDQLRTRVRMLESNIRVMKQEKNRLAQDITKQDAFIKDNVDKIKLNKTLPYLVANVVEVRSL
jgi:26S proteasome regulatory subunit T5